MALVEDRDSTSDLSTATHRVALRKMAHTANAVAVAQLALQKSGNGPAELVQRDGQTKTTPTAYANLASFAEPVLDKVLETLELRPDHYTRRRRGRRIHSELDHGFREVRTLEPNHSWVLACAGS